MECSILFLGLEIIIKKKNKNFLYSHELYIKSHYCQNGEDLHQGRKFLASYITLKARHF